MFQIMPLDHFWSVSLSGLVQISYSITANHHASYFILQFPCTINSSLAGVGVKRKSYCENPMDGSSGVKILVRFYIDPMPRSENGVNEQIIFSTAWSTDQMKKLLPKWNKKEKWTEKITTNFNAVCPCVVKRPN